MEAPIAAMNIFCSELKAMLAEEHPDISETIKPPKQLSACECNAEAQAEILAASSDACLFPDVNDSWPIPFKSSLG